MANMPYSAEDQEALEQFLSVAHASVPHPKERPRVTALLESWASAWNGKNRVVRLTRSNHGAFLHFALLIGHQWAQAFTFIASHQHGFSLRGPDPDRTRKSHKQRNHRLDSSSLDALFDAWSQHPEARPAGHAVEFFLEETPDDIWKACLQSVVDLLLKPTG
jgi:hypothetical protein